MTEPTPVPDPERPVEPDEEPAGPEPEWPILPKEPPTEIIPDPERTVPTDPDDHP